MQVMTDIEVYFGPVGNAFQLSAVAFDMDGKINDPHELIQAEDCWFDGFAAEYPLSETPGTRKWWAAPEQASAREQLLRGVRERAEPLIRLLERFEKFVKPRLGKKGGHWANAPTYDLDILHRLYGYHQIGSPWHFRQERCMRTIMQLSKKLSPLKMPDMEGVGLVKHCGLHDAARQAVLVQAAYRSLGLRAGDYARTGQSSDAVS